MRGPGLRVMCDVRRTWQCPRCGYIRRAPATQTTVRCQCQQDELLMKLVEGQRYAKPVPQQLDLSWEYVPDANEIAREEAAAQQVALLAEETAAKRIEAEDLIDDVAPAVTIAEDDFGDGVDSDSDSDTQSAAETKTPAGTADAVPSDPKKKKKRRRRKPRPPQADGGNNA